MATISSSVGGSVVDAHAENTFSNSTKLRNLHHETVHSFYPIANFPAMADPGRFGFSMFKNSLMLPTAKIEGRSSNTVLKHNSPLRDMFAKMCLKQHSKESTALIYKGNAKMTFKELEELSNALAKYMGNQWLLENGGTGRIKSNVDGDAVVVFCSDSLQVSDQMVALLFAVFSLGLTFMAIDPTTSNYELHRILYIIDPCMIITDSKCPILNALTEENDNLRVPLLLLDKIWGGGGVMSNIFSNDRQSYTLDPSLESWTTVRPENRTVAIFLTAGSSGQPKPTRIGLRELYNVIHWKKKVLPSSEHENYSLTFPPWDVNFLADVLIPILQGKCLVLFDRNDMDNPSTFLESIYKTNVSRLTLTPPDFQSLMTATMQADNKLYISKVKIWTITGNFLPIPSARYFLKLIFQMRDALLLFMYGSVEVVGQATYELYEDVSDLDRKILNGVASMGTPICNTNVFIVDEGDKCVPQNTVGEIAFSGSCVCSGGYTGCMGGGFTKLGPNGEEQPKNTSRLYRTGDVGKIIVDSSGIKRLYVLGRVSDVVTPGKNPNYLSQISQEIFASGHVQACSALVYNPGRESIVTIVACVLKENASPQDILDVLKRNNIHPNLPWIIPVRSIPVLPSGRVDCKTIRQMYRNCLVDCDPKSWKSLDLLPEHLNHVKILCRAVAQSCNIPLEYVIENFELSFWNIGGSSVDAISAFKFIVKHGYPIDLQDITTSSTLSQILEKMIAAKSVAKVDKCSQCSPTHPYRILPISASEEQAVLRLLVNDRNSGGIGGIKQVESVTEYWTSILEAVRHYGIGLIAKNRKDQIIGVMLSIATTVQLKIKKPPKEIMYCLELFQACKKVSKYVQWRSSQGKILQVYFVSLDYAHLQPGQDATVIYALLRQTEQVAKEQGFTSIVIEATSSLIQEVCVNLMDLETLFEFQIRRFKSKDKCRPFIKEVDHKKIGVYYSDLRTSAH